MENKFDFSVDMQDVDRSARLAEAADRIDYLQRHLHGQPEGNEAQPSEAGNFIRESIGDEASLAVFPDIYEITDRDYLARDLIAPVRFTELKRRFNFYWIRFPVGLAPRRNWDFKRIEVRVEFNPDSPEPHLRPKAYQILPDKKFQDLIQAHQGLELNFNESFVLEAKPLPIVAPAGKIEVGVDGVANGGFGAVLGPFHYRVTRAKIDHNATGMEWVFWRIDGSEYFREITPELVIVAQVPKETEMVTMQARLQAYHDFNFASAGLKDLIGELPRVLRNYIKDGAPLADKKSWNLTPVL